MTTRFLYTFIIWILCFYAAPTKSEVEITINQSAYAYSSNPRLSDVLAPVALKENWYWPSSQLFRSNTNNAQDSQNQIVEMLSSQANSKASYYGTFNNLVNQLLSWDVADRVNIQVDFDLARTVTQHNPRLENGQYKMFLSTRPTHLYVFGAVENALNLPFTDNNCVVDIIANIELSTYAHKSYVYVISPNSEINKIAIALWNASQCASLMPGSMVYIPLQEGHFSDKYSIINRRIAELAVNRIAVQ